MLFILFKCSVLFTLLEFRSPPQCFPLLGRWRLITVITKLPLLQRSQLLPFLLPISTSFLESSQISFWQHVHSISIESVMLVVISMTSTTEEDIRSNMI
jgi:hypothetical protein